jgi:hypothetical protein
MQPATAREPDRRSPPYRPRSHSGGCRDRCRRSNAMLDRAFSGLQQASRPCRRADRRTGSPRSRGAPRWCADGRVLSSRCLGVPRPRAELQQRRSRTLTRLLAALAGQPSGEVVYAGCRDVRQFGKRDITLCPAPGAFDLQPREAAVERLVDRRRRVDRLAVGPHALVPASTGKLVCLPDQGFAAGAQVIRLPGKHQRHAACLRQFLFQGLADAA